MNMESTPTVTVKRKNIQTVLDYCLENKIEFTVKTKFASSDEWDVEINVTNIKKAIVFGMFLKENKLELNGHTYSPAASAPAPAASTRGSKKSEAKENGHSKAEPAGISFGEEENNNVEFNLDSSAN
jgi:hypothetical protein